MWDFEQFSIRHAHFFLWVCVLRARISNSPQVSNSPTRSTHQQQQHQHFIIIIIIMGMISFSSCSWLSSREQIIWRWKIIKSLFMLLYAQKWKINNESNIIDVNAKWKTSLRRMFSLLFFIHPQCQIGNGHIHPYSLFSFTPWVFPFSDEHKNGDDDDADVASRPFFILGVEWGLN